ncbi:hypothetical protein [Actinomyces vulturis]|uniref:hypothetical protein n=1 Tax=Actinomyces vulturis TaxID=1857645 RepID=UPI00159EE1C5|nr:hypothetical protein [Actinomyces vulturis]
MKKHVETSGTWLLLAAVFVLSYVASLFYMDWRFGDAVWTASDNSAYIFSMCSIVGALAITTVVGWSMGVTRTNSHDLP